MRFRAAACLRAAARARREASSCRHRSPLLAPADARSNQLAKIPDDVVDDASLLRSTSIVCPRCSTADGVMIQAKPLATDDKIKLILVCANRDCAHKWQL